MRNAVRLCLLLVTGLWVCLEPSIAQSQSVDDEDVARSVYFEIRRLEAQNPSTRARATAQLRTLSLQPDAREELESALPKLRKLLEDEQSIVRWNSAVTLIRCEDADSVEHAYDVLRKDAVDPLYSVRLGVIETLIDIGPTDAALSILQELAEHDDDSEVQDEASYALDRIHDVARERRRRLNEPEPDSPNQQPGPTSAPWQREEPDPELVVATFTDDLRRLPNREAFESVTESIEGLAAFDIDGASISISSLLAPELPNLLAWVRSQDDPDPMTIRLAAKLLGRGDRTTLEALVPALEDDASHVRAAAAFALMLSAAELDGAARGPESPMDVAAPLVFSLADEAPDVRAYAAIALGKSRSTRYTRDLLRLLEDPNVRVRAAAARALTELGEEGASSPALQQMNALLAMDDSASKALALDALGAMRAPGARDYAERLIWSDEPSVAYAAGAVLVALRDGRIPRARSDELEDPRPWIQQAAQIAMRTPQGTRRRRPNWNQAGRVVAADGAEPSAEPGTMRGRVEAGAGWEFYSVRPVEVPLTDATVAYDGPVSGTIATDTRGDFTIPDIPPGIYQLRVSCGGYLARQTTVQVEPGVSTMEWDSRISVLLHTHY